jgi:small subunit ribosomal protein S17
MVGKVVSDKMQKTLVVEVPWVQHHPIYRKILRRKTRVYVHDPKELGRLGDTVRVAESRPFSHLKRFLLTDIVHRREVVEAPREEAIVAQVTAPAAVVEQDEAETEPVIESVGEVEEEADAEAEASDEPEAQEAPEEAEAEVEAEPEAEEAQAEAEPEAEETPAEVDEEAPAEPEEPSAEAGTVEEEGAKDAEAAAPTPEKKEEQR